MSRKALLKKLAVRFFLYVAAGLVAVGFYALFFRASPAVPPQCVIQSVGRVQALALSPDGKTLADASEFDRVTLYNAETGQEGQILPINSFWIAFSRDGKKLMTVGTSPKANPSDLHVAVWDVATGRRLSTLPITHYAAMLEAISPDLTCAVVRQGQGCSVYDLTTGRLIKAFPAPHGWWNSAFSPNGRLLAVGNDTGLGNLLLWDTKTWQPIHALDGQAVGCSRIRFSPEGTLLAARTTTALIWWDTRTWQKRGGITLAAITRFAEPSTPRFSSDSRFLAMIEAKKPPPPSLWYNIVKLWNHNIYEEQEITHVWDCSTGRQTITLPNQILEEMSHANERMLTQFSPQVSHQGDPRLFLLWDIERGHVVSQFQISPDPDDTEYGGDYIADISDDGKVAAFGSRASGMIRIWRTP